MPHTQSYRTSLILGIIFTILAIGTLTAQPSTGEGPRYPGTTGKPIPYDTTGLKEAQERTEESSGLLEQAIDPATYLLGPNDRLTLTVWTARTQQFDVTVTPDAKLVIPTVGEVDIHEKTLAEAKEIVRTAVAKVYKVDASLALRKVREFKVSLIGAVKHPGIVPATATSRVAEIIDLGGGTQTKANKRDVELIRNNGKERIQVDLIPYYAFGDLTANPIVQGGDVIKVNISDPTDIITILGAVRADGEFPYKPGDSISSLIRYAFGFTADAFYDSIEVVSVNDNGAIKARTFHKALPDGTILNDMPLRSGDQVFVRSKPRFQEQNRVVLKGEVRYPGAYAIVPGKTRLREIIERAGGFTEQASLTDAQLIRVKAKDEPDPYFDQINRTDPSDRTPEEAEYFRIKFLENKGLMSIDFEELMSGDEDENLHLINEDSLYVPVRKGYIRVSGKVKSPGNFTYTSDRGYKDYITLAGGYGWKAEVGETQVIKARTSDRFLADNDEEYTLEPGDAIFVPEEPPSDFWAGIATTITIIAQVATIIAVVISIFK